MGCPLCLNPLCNGECRGNWSPLAQALGGAFAGNNPFVAGPAQFAAAQAAAHQQAQLANQAILAQLAQNTGYFPGLPTFSSPEPPIPQEPLENAGITVGEIIGWRIWKVAAGYLRSFSADRTWAPNEPMTGNPTDYGSEGVWAFKERGRAIQKMLENESSAYGAVTLWGDVIEHELGYRAECARIISVDDIYVPLEAGWRRWTKPSLLLVLRSQYGVGSFEEYITAASGKAEIDP